MLTEAVTISPAVLAFVVTLLSSAVVATIVAQTSENKRYLIEKRIQRYEAFLKQAHQVHRILKTRWGQINDKPIKQDDFWDFSENLNDIELVASRKVLTRAKALDDKIGQYVFMIYKTNKKMVEWDDQNKFEEFKIANRNLIEMDEEFFAQMEKLAQAMRVDIQGRSYGRIWHKTEVFKKQASIHGAIILTNKRGEVIKRNDL